MGKISTKQIVLTIAAAATLGIVGAANGVAFSYAGIIDHALNGQSREIDSEAFEEVSAQSSELVKKIAEEGIALVRNENKALPLDLGEEKRINVFGWASTDNGFLLKGIGSGSSTIQASKTVTLLGALREKGIEYNTELIQMYENYYKGNFSFATGSSSRQYIIEPPQSNYTDTIINNAVKFSDVALVTISRVAGENIGEIPQTQRKLGAGVSTDNSRHYLQISKEEEDLIKMCREKFDKVIVIINSSNQMELGFLEKYDVDACLNVGLMGQNGAEAIIAVRKDREESFIQKFFSNTYYKIMQKIAISNMPNGGFDCFMIDRKIINVLSQMKEKNTSLMGLILWCGFKLDRIYYVRKRREEGKSMWTLKKKFKYFTDSIVSFSYFPT